MSEPNEMEKVIHNLEKFRPEYYINKDEEGNPCEDGWYCPVCGGEIAFAEHGRAYEHAFDHVLDEVRKMTKLSESNKTKERKNEEIYRCDMVGNSCPFKWKYKIAETTITPIDDLREKIEALIKHVDRWSRTEIETRENSFYTSALKRVLSELEKMEPFSDEKRSRKNDDKPRHRFVRNDLGSLARYVADKEKIREPKASTRKERGTKA